MFNRLDLVFLDMQRRDQAGVAEYGKRLHPHNGRDALCDAYEEALDLVAYLRQAIYERDGQWHALTPASGLACKRC